VDSVSRVLISTLFSDVISDIVIITCFIIIMRFEGCVACLLAGCGYLVIIGWHAGLFIVAGTV
jgi:hypothetical protein